jgi:hypothetical protein
VPGPAALKSLPLTLPPSKPCHLILARASLHPLCALSRPLHSPNPCPQPSQCRICEVANALVAEAGQEPKAGSQEADHSTARASLSKSLSDWQQGSKTAGQGDGVMPDFEGLVLAYEGVSEYLCQYQEVAGMLLQFYRWMYAADASQQQQQQQAQVQAQQVVAA